MLDRRHALTSFGGIAAASLLIATRQAQAQAPAVPATTLGADAHRTDTLRVGTLSKEMSQIAINRASYPRVKEFAQFEYDEQLTIAQVLTDVNQPPPAPLDQTERAILTQLQQTSGSGFDMAYVNNELQGHQQLFAIQQEFLNGDPSNLDSQHIALLARTVIQMHLTMLSDLKNMLSAA